MRNVHFDTPKRTVGECNMKRCVSVYKSHRCIQYNNFKRCSNSILQPFLVSRCDPGYFKEQKVRRAFPFHFSHLQTQPVKRHWNFHIHITKLSKQKRQSQSRKILYEILLFVLFILLYHMVWYYMQIFKMETGFYFHFEYKRKSIFFLFFSTTTRTTSDWTYAKREFNFFHVVYVFAHSNQSVYIV